MITLAIIYLLYFFSEDRILDRREREMLKKNIK